MILRNRERTVRQSLTFAVAKACAVTFGILAAHVTVSVATDLSGHAASQYQAPLPSEVVVTVEQIPPATGVPGQR